MKHFLILAPHVVINVFNPVTLEDDHAVCKRIGKANEMFRLIHSPDISRKRRISRRHHSELH